jgi:signal transduction histidine kinase/ligand-binding sensor domain-containing protein/ActR/RegA family two-component response regulator
MVSPRVRLPWRHLLSMPLVVGLVASAQDARQELAGPGFFRKSWSTENGLPQNTVSAVLQARDGYLWIATFGGLCRFDGQTMRVYDTGNTRELSDNRVLALQESPDGTLWIGTESAGLFRNAGGRFESVLETAGESVHALGQDAQGRLVVCLQDRLEIRETASFRLQEEHALLQNWTLLLSRSGALFAGGQHGLVRLSDGRVERLSEEPVTCLAETDAGSIFVGGRCLWWLDGDRLRQWRPVPELDSGVRVLFAAADGSLWVGQRSSTLRLALEPASEPKLAGIEVLSALDRPVRCCGQDDGGGVWLGYEGAGLVNLRPAEVQGFGTAAGLPRTGINSVLADGSGGVFVGTSSGLFHGKAGAFTAVREAAQIRFAQGLARDTDGSFWIGGSGANVLRVSGGDSSVFGAAQGMPPGTVRAILRDSRGELWLGTDQGARVLRGEAISTPRLPPELEGEIVKLLVEAPDGALWIGSTRRLVRLDRERESFQSWVAGQELPYGEVRAVLPDSDGRAWVGTYGAGFCRLADARVDLVDEHHGLFDNSICSVAAFGDQLAVGSNRGCFLVSKYELDAVADGRQAVLACRPVLGPSGMSAEANGGVQPGACVSAGRAWFSGIDGVLCLDPDDLAPPSPPPRCHVEEIIVGESAWKDATDVVAPRGVRTVAFRLTGCDFSHPEQLRFRWRLSGAGETWSEPTYAREARFALPASGEYDFEAVAIGIDDQTSVEPARVHLSVPALLWETTGFQVGTAAFLLLASALLVRLGARRSAAQAARLQRIVEERTRALRAAQETLEERVRARTDELQRALDQLQDDHAKRQVLERQIQQLQRMESIGQLAGGVAHDFNNLLTVVLGSGALLQRDVADQPELAALVASICDAGDRGRRLTQHLLALASQQVVVPEVLELSSLVGDLATVLRPLVGGKIALTITPGARPAHVRAATSQIEQILINLCVNARDAMPDGGGLEIRIVPGDERVGLVVRDTGTGMSSAVAERAFEPFFTTKASGLGTGLGLSTVYGITKQLGGDVKLDSQLGRGTTVTLWLPSVAGVSVASTEQEARTLVPVRSVAASGTGLVRGTGLVGGTGSGRPGLGGPGSSSRPGSSSSTVLWIEDQIAVRTAVRMLLERLGWSVREAVSGDDALRQLRIAPHDIDIVLSDVLMPGLHGMALVEALRSTHSDLPIVFLSGYVDDRGTYRELLDAGLEILAKPPQAAALAAALEKARRRVTGSTIAVE